MPICSWLLSGNRTRAPTWPKDLQEMNISSTRGLKTWTPIWSFLIALDSSLLFWTFNNCIVLDHGFSTGWWTIIINQMSKDRGSWTAEVLPVLENSTRFLRFHLPMNQPQPTVMGNLVVPSINRTESVHSDRKMQRRNRNFLLVYLHADFTQTVRNRANRLPPTTWNGSHKWWW